MKTLLGKSYYPIFRVKPPFSKKSTAPQKEPFDLGFFLNERYRSIVYGKNTKTDIISLWDVEKCKVNKTLTESQKTLYAPT